MGEMGTESLLTVVRESIVSVESRRCASAYFANHVVLDEACVNVRRLYVWISSMDKCRSPLSKKEKRSELRTTLLNHSRRLISEGSLGGVRYWVSMRST